jgi:hypothetical protein
LTFDYLDAALFCFIQPDLQSAPERSCLQCLAPYGFVVVVKNLPKEISLWQQWMHNQEGDSARPQSEAKKIDENFQWVDDMRYAYPPEPWRKGALCR